MVTIRCHLRVSLLPGVITHSPQVFSSMNPNLWHSCGTGEQFNLFITIWMAFSTKPVRQKSLGYKVRQLWFLWLLLFSPFSSNTETFKSWYLGCFSRFCFYSPWAPTLCTLGYLAPRQVTALFPFCLLAFSSVLYFGSNNLVILSLSKLTFAPLLPNPIKPSGKFSIWDFVFQVSQASFVSLL